MNLLYSAMLAKADPSQVEGLARFFKTGPGQYGYGDKFLGIKVPVTRAVVKDCWRSVGFPELEECISSEYHEVRLAALLTLVEIFKHAGKRPPVKPGVTGVTGLPGATALTCPDALPSSCPAPTALSCPAPTALSCPAATGHLQQQCVDFYLAHTAFINNWDLVDLSCYPLLGEWLMDRDRSLLYELARSGRTIWEQRIGIVSTMTFVRHGQLGDTFALADILLHHPHDLIHKAVGWLLREAGKRDKPALEAWLHGTPGPAGGDGSIVMPGRGHTIMPGSDYTVMPGSDRASQMPRTMLRYAIEKFPEAERKAYLAK